MDTTWYLILSAMLFATGFSVVVQAADGSSRVVECHLKVEGDVSRVDLRAVAEALGFVVTDHLADQGKVYVGRKA